jgi:hypothetical protein
MPRYRIQRYEVYLVTYEVEAKDEREAWNSFEVDHQVSEPEFVDRDIDTFREARADKRIEEIDQEADIDPE